MPAQAAMPLINGGKIRAIGVSSATRTRSLPDLPTTLEAGVPNSDYNFWVGMAMPSKTAKWAPDSWRNKPILHIVSETTRKDHGSGAIDHVAINCDDIRGCIDTLKKDGMPFGPKKYDFKKSKGDASLLINVGPGGAKTLDAIDGTVDITAFDKKHIAGTIALSPSQITTIGVATTTVSRQPLVRTLRVSGRVEDDITRLACQRVLLGQLFVVLDLRGLVASRDAAVLPIRSVERRAHGAAARRRDEVALCTVADERDVIGAGDAAHDGVAQHGITVPRTCRLACAHRRLRSARCRQRGSRRCRERRSGHTHEEERSRRPQDDGAGQRETRRSPCASHIRHLTPAEGAREYIVWRSRLYLRGTQQPC